MTSCSQANNFFLRPFLTRDEYAYWNSHFCSVSSSCSFVCDTNPKDTTSATSDERMTSCVRNATGLPYCDGRRPSGVPVDHRNVFSDNCCNNVRKSMPCFQEFIPSTTNHEIMNASKRQCPCCTNTNIKESANQDTVFVGNSPSLQHLVPRTSQTENRLNRPTYCCHTRQGYDVYQESTPAKLREKMYGQFLFGDKSYGENLPRVSSSGHEGCNPKAGSAAPYDSTSAYGVHSELRSADCGTIKRKAVSPSEHERYSQGKCKKHCIGDDVNGSQFFQAPNANKNSNETWKHYQSEAPPISSCCIKNARRTINESRDIRKSCEMTTSPVQDCSEKKITPTTSGSGCKPGSQTLTETEPVLVDLTHDNSDVALKSHVSQVDDQILNGRNKPLERKDIDEVIKSAKPVQRKLMTNERTTGSDGCAFDHDYLPRLIGVLPSAMATMMSSLAK